MLLNLRKRLPGGILLTTLALALACSSGGSGGSGSGTTGTGYGLAPATGPGDVSAFFPAAAGDTWLYNTVSTGAQARTQTGLGRIEVTGTQPFLGHQATVFRQTSLGSTGYLDNYYLASPGGVTFLGNNDATDWLTASMSPHVWLLFPVAAGTVADFTRSDCAIGEDLDGDGQSETITVHVNVAVNFETVSVPAGTFPGAARIASTYTGSVRGSRDGTTVPFNATDTFWSAPGVGPVKNVQTASAGGLDAQATAELRGWTVGGLAHGLGLPFTAAPGLAPGDSDASNPGRPGIASDGQGFLAVTTRLTGPLTRRLTVARLDASGTGSTVLDITPPGADHLVPMSSAVAFDGANYLAICSQSDGGTYLPLVGVRVSPAGTVLDPSGITLAPAGGFSPSAAGNGAGALVVYDRWDQASSRYRKYGVLVDAAGQPGTEFVLLADPAVSSYGSATAFDGVNFLVVYTGQDTGGTRLLATRVSAAGVVLDPVPLVLAAPPCVPEAPAVAFDGSSYLVVWSDGRNVPSGSMAPWDLYGARVAPAGTLLDGSTGASGFLIDGGGADERWEPAVAFSGGSYLVCWSLGAYASTSPDSGVQAARVTPAAAVGSRFPLSGPPPASSRLHYPAVAASSQGAAAVWLVNNESGPKELDAVVAR